MGPCLIKMSDEDGADKTIKESLSKIKKSSKKSKDTTDQFGYDLLFDDLLIFTFLLMLAITFLYFFIRYLLQKRKESTSHPNYNTKRYRFGRMRKNSNHKPWLDPLDSLDSFQEGSHDRKTESEEENEEDEYEGDADELIQSNISREFVQNQLDPFELSPRETIKFKKWTWDWGDFFGIGMAAGCAILFIFILSSIEE